MKNLDPAQELEPANGDFVAYLKKLEEGKIDRLGGLHVSLPDGDQQGMVLVQTPKEIADDKLREKEKRDIAVRASAAAAMMLLGPALALTGIGLIVFAIAAPGDFDFLIPFGMVSIFFSVVLTAEGRKRRKNRR